MAGQRLLQGSSDPFLGSTQARGVDGVTRDFYVRQLWNWKVSPDLSRQDASTLAVYARMCAWTLARGHARSGDRFAIAAYLGRGPALDAAMAAFAPTTPTRTSTTSSASWPRWRQTPRRRSSRAGDDSAAAAPDGGRVNGSRRTGLVSAVERTDVGGFLYGAVVCGGALGRDQRARRGDPPRRAVHLLGAGRLLALPRLRPRAHRAARRVADGTGGDAGSDVEHPRCEDRPAEPRFRRAGPSAAGLSRDLTLETSVLKGGLPALVVYIGAAALGAEPSTAGFIALERPDAAAARRRLPGGVPGRAPRPAGRAGGVRGPACSASS